MKTRSLMWLAIALLSVVLICGCRKEKAGGQTAEELTKQGWAKFQAGNNVGASADFNAALGLDATANNYEAYLGLGWAELRRSRAGLAENAFLTYLTNVSNSNDAKAGLAFAYHAQEKFSSAISMANDVLSSSPQWSFQFDNKINNQDLALVLAQSYYEMAYYSQSLAVVKQHFNPPNFNPDVETPEGRAELAEKIEELYKTI